MCLQKSMDGRRDHSSRVDNDLEVAVMSLTNDGFLVQMSQDVHPGHILTAALQGQSLGAGRRPSHSVGEHIILKHETMVNTILSFQQRQQLRPTGDRMIKKMYW